jgi:hypothetical protein
VTCFTGLAFCGVDRRPRLPPLPALCERRLALAFEAARPLLDLGAARPRLDFDAARLLLDFDALELLRVRDWPLDCAMQTAYPPPGPRTPRRRARSRGPGRST